MARWWKMVLFKICVSFSRKCINFMRMESNCFEFFTCVSEVTKSHFMVDAHLSLRDKQTVKLMIF